MIKNPTRGMNDIRETLARFFDESKPRGVIAAYLFGSQASGRAHKESDIDIGVLLDRAASPRTKDRFEMRLALTGEIIRAFHWNAVDLVVLNDVSPSLGRHIVTSGVRVFGADAEAIHAFERDVQLRAADLAPFLLKMRRIRLEALLR